LTRGVIHDSSLIDMHSVWGPWSRSFVGWASDDDFSCWCWLVWIINQH